jgi:hypothetical protein
MHRLEANRKKKTTSQKLNPRVAFHKRKVFTTSTNPLIDSRDDMRALATDKASAAQEWKRKSIKQTEKGTQDRQNTGKKITLRSSSSFQIFDTFSAQRDELPHQDLSKKDVSRKFTQGTKQKH